MIRSYTAAEIAHIWRKPIGTVYRLASENDWRRTPDRKRPRLYNANDVEATMNGAVLVQLTPTWQRIPSCPWPIEVRSDRRVGAAVSWSEQQTDGATLRRIEAIGRGTNPEGIYAGAVFLPEPPAGRRLIQADDRRGRWLEARIAPDSPSGAT